jgi:hypothetical protein
LQTDIFGGDQIQEAVVYGADVYIETHSFSKIISTLFGTESSIRSQLSVVLPYVFDHSALVGVKGENKYSWLAVFILKDQGISNDVLSGSGLEYEYEIIGKYLLVSSDKDLLNETKGVVSNTSRNLTQNPLFAINKSRKPGNGRILIYVKGASGRELLGRASDLIKEQNILDLYNKFLENSEDYIVVR